MTFPSPGAESRALVPLSMSLPIYPEIPAEHIEQVCVAIAEFWAA